MDWFSWLSKTGLDPSLVYEYGLALGRNEIEEEDISYFNHEFLQSMGISIAKHRLEILKLARKEKGHLSLPRPMSRILAAVRKTKKCLAKYIQRWIGREDRALVLVSKSSRWRGSRLKRNKQSSLPNDRRLMLTNGSPVAMAVATPARIESFSNPAVSDLKKETKGNFHYSNGYWASGIEHIRWDSMFQDLKPT